MIIKFVQLLPQKIGDDRYVDANCLETVIDNIEEYTLTKWIKVDTLEQYRSFFKSQNPRPRCIFDQPDPIMEYGQAEDEFKPFTCNRLWFKKKGQEFSDTIFFDCQAYVMNDLGKTVEYQNPTNSRVYPS